MTPFFRNLTLVALLTAGLSSPGLAQRGGNFLYFTSTEADKVSVPSFTLPPSGPFTLEAWVYYNGFQYHPSSYNTVFEFGNDNPWFGVGGNGAVTLYTSVSGGTVPVRTWVHLAYTWDGTTSTVYLDGTAVATSTVAPPRTGSGLGIGHNTGDTGWQGYIDEAMVWSTARTAAQIQSDRQNGAAANAGGLVIYYKFDEGTTSQSVANQVSSGPSGVLGSTGNAEANDPARVNFVVNSARNPSANAVAQLQPNFPNPFTAATAVPFTLHRAGHVRLSVLDLTGREVALLLDEKRAAGSHTAPFQAAKLAAGVYVCQLDVDGQRLTRQMVVR